jgi:hypothetical protein
VTCGQSDTPGVQQVNIHLQHLPVVRLLLQLYKHTKRQTAVKFFANSFVLFFCNVKETKTLCIFTQKCSNQILKTNNSNTKWANASYSQIVPGILRSFCNKTRHLLNNYNYYCNKQIYCACCQFIDPDCILFNGFHWTKKATILAIFKDVTIILGVTCQRVCKMLLRLPASEVLQTEEWNNMQSNSSEKLQVIMLTLIQIPCHIEMRSENCEKPVNYNSHEYFAHFWNRSGPTVSLCMPV